MLWCSSCFTLRIFIAVPSYYILSSGPHRAQFLIESVNDLRNTLRQLGSDLVVAAGPPEEHIPKLIPPGTKATVRRRISSYLEVLSSF